MIWDLSHLILFTSVTYKIFDQSIKPNKRVLIFSHTFHLDLYLYILVHHFCIPFTTLNKSYILIVLFSFSKSYIEPYHQSFLKFTHLFIHNTNSSIVEGEMPIFIFYSIVDVLPVIYLYHQLLIWGDHKYTHVCKFRFMLARKCKVFMTIKSLKQMTLPTCIPVHQNKYVYMYDLNSGVFNPTYIEMTSETHIIICSVCFCFCLWSCLITWPLWKYLRIICTTINLAMLSTLS